ncbi:hypothetical protein D3C84_1159700 [compost metagenome]
MIVHHLQFTPGNRTPGIADSQHLPDAHRRLRMVAGDHFHANPRPQAVADGGNGLRSRRVHHPGDTEQNNALLQIRMVKGSLLKARRFPRRRHHA